MPMKRMITQIGSLPHENVDEAIAYSLKHDIPFLPELPKLGESMLSYIKNPGQLSCLEKFKRHEFATVKIQCIGPATLVSASYTADKAIERVYEHISAIITGLCSKEIILFLDEPSLGQIGFDFEKLWTPIFETFNVVSGVHVCSNMDWDKLFKSKIEIISFDASKFDITIYPEYRRAKRIAWGVKDLEDVKDFQKGDMLTLPCGMSPNAYSVNDSEIEFKKLEMIAKKIKATLL